VGTYNANQATVEAMKANVKQLETLQSFEKIYAPFDVLSPCVTLMWAISSTPVAPQARGPTLFHIAQPGKLRVMSTYPRSTHKLPRQG